MIIPHPTRTDPAALSRVASRGVLVINCQRQRKVRERWEAMQPKPVTGYIGFCEWLRGRT